MKMKFKGVLLALALMFAITLGFIPGVETAMTVYAADDSGVCSSCGNIAWELDGTTLTISKVDGASSGEMCDECDYDWNAYDSVFDSLAIEKVVIKDGVTSIGESVFYGCENLTSILIPDSVTSIGPDVFRECDSLTSIILPDNVTVIGSYAFYGSGLTEIVIPAGVTNIEDSVFGACGSLISVTIPDGVISIGGSAFSGCRSLTSIIIPDSVTSIGGWAFSGCESLTSIKIPDSVTSIGDTAFFCCDGLTEILLPNNITSIGDSTFLSCNSLTSIIIPDGVTSIGYQAFYGCSSLISITIPDKVTRISKATFEGCSSLDSIIIPDSVTYIDESAFKDCSSLKSITIPDSVTHIEDSAFEGCSALTNIILPDSITSISFYVFKNCSSLTNITLPNNLTTIANFAFSGCDSLAEIIFPNSVTYIGKEAFYGCESLTSIEIPENVTSIGKEAFYFCKNLSNVICPCAFIEQISDGDIFYNSYNSYPTITYTHTSDSCTHKADSYIPGAPTIFFTFETNDDIEYDPANGYNYTSFDLDIGALCMVPLDNSNPTYENVKVTIDLPEGLSFSATENVKTMTKELGAMSLTGTARQDMTVTVYPDNAYETQGFEVKASVTADGYDVANTDTFTVDVKTLVNYDEYELLVYADYHDCTFGIGQTMNLIPAMVKDGEPLEGEEGWSYSIKDTSIAEITKYTETEYAPAPTITGNKAGTTVLTVVHVPTGRSVDLYLTIVEEHKVHNIKSLEQLPEGYAIYNAGMYIDEFSTEKSGSGYNVKFNVYNGLQCHGAVEVYNSEGQIIEIERIDKFEAYQTGLVDVLASLGNLILTTADGTLDSYRNKLYAEETKIEVFVPDGGYIIVSNNVTESIGAYIYNGVDLAFWAYSEGTEIAKAISSEEQSDAIIESASKSVVEQYVNAVKASVITDGVENNFQKKIYESIKEDFATDMVEGFGETFINNASEFFVELDIDLWAELKNSAISYGDSTLVEAFEKVGGPAGIALSGIFKTNEYLNVFMQLVDMEKTRDIEGLRVNIDVDDDKLVSNNVIVENAQGLPIANNELVVEDISEKSESQYILEEFARASQIRIYDITMYRDDKEVQPDGSIRVRIPVPALYDQEKCAIYRAEKDGSYTNMNAYYEDGYIVFVTTHLSTYVLVEEAPMTLNAPTIAKVSNTSAGVQISWNKVADATYYNVYRSTSKTGRFTMIKSNVAAVSYVDTTAVAGKTYYYKVVAGNDKIKSDYSAVSVGLICLKAPTFKKIVNVVSGVHVYWNASSGAKTYNVYRSTNKTSGYMLIKKGLTATHYIDTSAVSGTTYYYKVVATNGTTTSVYSAPFNAITYVGTPDITSRANSAYGVRLGWNKISGATGYAIYRKPYDGDTWVRVTTIKGNSTFTWTDSSVKANNGTVYKYTIRALAGSDMKTLSGCRSTGRTMTRLTSRTLSSAVKTSATSIKCNWTTTSVCNGYEVRFMVGSTVYKTFTVGNYKTGVKTFTGLKAGQTYKVQVRSYKKVDGVGTFYSAWSTEKMVTL